MAGIIVLIAVVYTVYLFRAVRRSPKPLSLSDNIAVASWYMNLTVLAVAIASLLYAKVSYDFSEKTAVDQSVASQLQQKTLDSSRVALEGMVQLAQDQQAKMSKNLEIAQSQQNVLSQQLDRMNTLSRIAQAELQKQIQEANLHPILLVRVMSIRDPEYRVTLPANGTGVSVLNGGQLSSVTRKNLPFFIRNVGNTPLKNPRFTAYVGAPNKLVCLDYISFGLERSSPTPPFSIEYCDNEIQPLPDILPNPDPTLKQLSSDLEFLLVYDEVPGTAFFDLVVVISADNFPTTSYGVQVQYRGLFPCGEFCK